MSSLTAVSQPRTVGDRSVELACQQSEVAESVDARIAVSFRSACRERPMLHPGLWHDVFDGIAAAPDAHAGSGNLAWDPSSPVILDRFEHHADTCPAQLAVDRHDL